MRTNRALEGNVELGALISVDIQEQSSRARVAVTSVIDDEGVLPNFRGLHQCVLLILVAEICNARHLRAELRTSLRASSDRLDESWKQMLRTLRVEREALAANIAAEREGVVAAFDTERARISADAAQITARAVDTSWQELRKRSLQRIAEWSKNQQAVQESDLMVSFGVVRCDVHRVMHRKWGLYMSSQ